ncbi:MAG: DUF4398 domain-containing protein [Thioalkalispiraceae bacterium]|jgi:hypothetical protein
MRKIIPFAIAAAFALGACASGGPSYNKNDAASAITAAEHELDRAKAKTYEWRDTGKMIKKAKSAMKDGDFDKAVKLANKAKRQSTHALAQYEEQKNVKPRY